MRLFHLSTEFTKKEKKKQKEKEMTADTNLNSYKFCIDKREQFPFRLTDWWVSSFDDPLGQFS